jgi:hypothetical protein
LDLGPFGGLADDVGLTVAGERELAAIALALVLIDPADVFG